MSRTQWYLKIVQIVKELISLLLHVTSLVIGYGCLKPVGFLVICHLLVEVLR